MNRTLSVLIGLLILSIAGTDITFAQQNAAGPDNGFRLHAEPLAGGLSASTPLSKAVSLGLDITGGWAFVSSGPG